MGPHIDFISVSGAELNPYSIINSSNFEKAKNFEEPKNTAIKITIIIKLQIQEKETSKLSKYSYKCWCC